MPDLTAHRLTPTAFAPFGDVLDATGDFRLINDGMCQSHHDRAHMDFGQTRARAFRSLTPHPAPCPMRSIWSNATPTAAKPLSP